MRSSMERVPRAVGILSSQRPVSFPAMARVRPVVFLDEPGRTFLPGETVRGVVRVEVDEDATCRALSVHVGWRTGGEANATENFGDGVLLGSGEWKGGDRPSFPFSVPIPPGPPTYAGRHFDVAWAVRAVAALSFAFDGKGETAVTVAPEPVAGSGLATKEDSGCFEVGCAVV